MQVAGELLGTVRSAESLQAEAGRASGEGGAACCSDDEKAAALELATLHMHLRALADRPGHPVTEGGTTDLHACLPMLSMLTTCNCQTVQKTVCQVPSHPVSGCHKDPWIQQIYADVCMITQHCVYEYGPTLHQVGALASCSTCARPRSQR